jgi:hypothetical protein
MDGRRRRAVPGRAPGEGETDHRTPSPRRGRAAGKDFDMMIYPMRKHDIADRPARRHLFEKMLEFWKRYL